MQGIMPGNSFQISRRPPSFSDPGFEDAERLLLVDFEGNDTRRLNDPRFICFRVYGLVVTEAAGKSGSFGQEYRLRTTTVAFIHLLLDGNGSIFARLQLLAQVIFFDLVCSLIDPNLRSAMFAQEQLELRTEI